MADSEDQINWLLARISGLAIITLGLVYCFAIPENPNRFSRLIQDLIPGLIVVLLGIVVADYLLRNKNIKFGRDNVHNELPENRSQLIAPLIAPKVIQGLPHDRGCLCLLQPSELFFMNAVVSIFHVEGEYERFVGNGRVLNVQGNGIIQVLIQELNDGNEEIFSNITSDQRTTINNIRIKPIYLQTN